MAGEVLLSADGVTLVNANGVPLSVQSVGGTKLWAGTQAAYDAIGTKDPTTLYFITA